MGNHAHIIIEEGDESLSKTVQRALVRYATWFNAKYSRTGHLFEGRFKSTSIESPAYLISALRYVHRNPVKAGICRHEAEYRWSSKYCGEDAFKLVDEERLSDLDADEAHEVYWDNGGNVNNPDHSSIDEASADLFAQRAEALQAMQAARLRVTDSEARRIMASSSGVNSGAAFQRLDKEGQKAAVLDMLNAHCSLRQIARLTGLSKGLIESWSRARKK
jgi:hypothetical protein